MNESKIKKSNFFDELKTYGIARLVFSPDSIISIIIFVVLFQDYLSLSGNFLTLNSNTTTNIVAIASTLFSIIIASVAIILSFSGSQFVAFIRKTDAFKNILFSFWFASTTYLAVILLTFFRLIIDFSPPLFFRALFNAFVISLFVYAILQTFYLVKSIINFAHFLELYEEINNIKTKK